MNALDYLIIELTRAGWNVCEMTGREHRTVQKDGEFEIERTYDYTTLNANAQAAFMRGELDVLIISDIASTGVSLHADPTLQANARRRTHIILGLAWSPERNLQQIGRTNRSNQREPPMYLLVTTNLVGERRIALIVYDRRSIDVARLNQFALDSNHTRAVLDRLVNHLITGKAKNGEQHPVPPSNGFRIS